MKPILPSQGAAPGSSFHTGQVTREQIHTRTRELAGLAGRGPLQVSQNDYDQARCELTGESDGERQEAVLERISKPGRPPVTRNCAKRNETETEFSRAGILARPPVPGEISGADRHRAGGRFELSALPI